MVVADWLVVRPVARSPSVTRAETASKSTIFFPENFDFPTEGFDSRTHFVPSISFPLPTELEGDRVGHPRPLTVTEMVRAFEVAQWPMRSLQIVPKLPETSLALFPIAPVTAISLFQVRVLSIGFSCRRYLSTVNFRTVSFWTAYT